MVRTSWVLVGGVALVCCSASRSSPSIADEPLAGAVRIPSAAAERNRRPNVVLFFADDVGAECFGCYGGESYRTPRIDALAAGGLQFTAAHSTPLCTPSRVRLMTGRDSVFNYWDFGVLHPGEESFGQWFQRAGYVTAVAGKWQLFGNRKDGPKSGTGTRPEDAGFARWCLWQIFELGSRYSSPVLEIDGTLHRRGVDDYGPHVVRDWALEFLEENREQSFFLYYPMILAHDPFVATPQGEAGADGSRQDHFADMIACMDEIVGSVADRLAQLGLAEDTLLLFLTDNGTHSSIRSRRGGEVIPGGKGTAAAIGTRIPLIAHWPGTIEPGSTWGGLVDLCDFVPTLAELTGIEVPQEPKRDGISFAPILRGDQPERVREWIHLYYCPRPLSAAAQEIQLAYDSEYKLYVDGQLFDLRSDPGELTPIVARDDTEATRAARTRLQAVLDAYPERGLSLAQKEAEPTPLPAGASDDG